MTSNTGLRLQLIYRNFTVRIFPLNPDIPYLFVVVAVFDVVVMMLVLVLVLVKSVDNAMEVVFMVIVVMLVITMMVAIVAVGVVMVVISVVILRAIFSCCRWR